MSIEKLRANLARATNHLRPPTAWIATVAEVEAALLDYGALMAEVSRLRAELGYIANARFANFTDAEEFRAWAQNRARHALGEKPGELSIKKGKP